MRKRILFLLIIIHSFSVCCFVNAQQNVDSLVSDLKKYEPANTASSDLNLTGKVDLLIKITNQYRVDGDYKKAEEYGKNALSLAQFLNYKKGAADAHVSLGNLYNEQANYGDALHHYSEAIKLHHELDNKRDVGQLYSKIGVIQYDQKKYDEALKSFQSGLKIGKDIGDKYLISGCYGNIGRINKIQGNYTDALSNLQTSLKVAEEAKMQGGISTIYKNIGQVSSEQGSIQEGLKTQISNLKNDLDYQEQIAKEQTIEHKQKLELKEKELALTSKEKDLEKINNQKNQAELEQQRILNENLQITNDKNKIAIQLEQANVASKERQRNYFIAGSFLLVLVSFLILRNFMNQKKSNRIISKERDRSDELLLNILPFDVAEELKKTGTAKAKDYDLVTVMFTDFKDFTLLSESMKPDRLVAELDYCFSSFDKIIQKNGLEKIKTIGDAYMCAGGIPNTNPNHPADVIKAGIEIRNFIANYNNEKAARKEAQLEIRIGINSGPVVAGIVGLNKFAYDIWGDTVNLASRMETSGYPGKINISGNTFELVKNQFKCEYRGKINAKNKGEIDMYFVESK